MKKYILFVYLLTSFISIRAQDGDLHLKPLPDSLRLNANSVLQEESTIFEVKSAGKAIFTYHSLETILNEAARGELSFNIGVNKFSSLESVAVTVYNAAGKQIMEYGKKDLASYIYDENLVADGKQYTLSIPTTSYPVHIRKEFVLKYNGLTSYPDYYIQHYYQSVRKSSYKVIVPADLDIRLKQYNYSEKPVITTEKNNMVYYWTVADKPALKFEEGSLAYNDFPRISFAPNKFSLDGYEGDLTSWKTFGNWYGDLGKQSHDLSPETNKFISSLVKDAATDKEKAALIYKYLQNNFRYVSIQLGIGGFKPFNASFTDKKKYGDCKALSTYTQACLAAAGIRSHQALINAGYNGAPVDPAFPANSFNHVILCVPMEKDSLWLECTSSTNDFGVLGGFTENRNALLVTDDGGVLVSTPKSRSTDNQAHVTTTVKMIEDGSGTAFVRLRTTGAFNTGELLKENEDGQKAYFVSLGFLPPEVMEIKGENNSYNAEMNYSKIPSFIAGNKMFLHPSMHTFTNTILPADKDRISNYYFHMPYIKNDTTIYQFPEGFVPDNLPVSKELKFYSGKFNIKYEFNAGNRQLITVSTLELFDHIVPAAKYAEAKEFYDSVLALYKNKIVIIRKS